MPPIADTITAFHLRTHPVRMAIWDGRRWFVATDVARAVGNVSLHSIQTYVPVAHKRELALRLPDGELDMLVLSEQGLRPVLVRRKSPRAAEFLAKVATLPTDLTRSAKT